jgi:3-oxoacyl-[acyl-carrier protein] reductase
MVLKDKVAIITGAAQGIGKSIAENLAAAGANIAICDVAVDAASATAEEIAGAYGVKTYVEKVDVSNTEQVEAFISNVHKKFGQIDILVNNAGITRDTLAIRMKDDDWNAVININLTGTFLFCRAVAKIMMKQRHGKIVNISSVIGLMGNPGQANYSASKAGVIGLTKTFAKELATRGVNVNAVAPGYIQTKMTDVLKDEVKQLMLKFIPLAKFGTPEDVAGVVNFLVSPAADYVTGEVIRIDGGMAM